MTFYRTIRDFNVTETEFIHYGCAHVATEAMSKTE